MSRDPLVTPTPPINQRTQEEFRLLTLGTPEGNVCSASMLNGNWAITATHCMFPTPKLNTPQSCQQWSPNQITLTGNWTGPQRTEQVRRIVLYGTCPGWGASDIALLHLRTQSYFSSSSLKLHDQRPGTYDRITAYGRGINTLAYRAEVPATGLTTDFPTTTDGLFRTATFSITSVGVQTLTSPPITYSFPGSPRGATIAGGDSGGPSFIQEWDSNTINRKLEWRLIGVHSNCSTECLSGQDCTTWTWVSATKTCTDAAIIPVRDRILADIEVVDFEKSPSLAPPTPPTAEALSKKRALYAMNIDEPLVAPPNAANDVGLTFQNCFWSPDFCLWKVDSELNQWYYDLSMHRLIHAPSGKCVIISGARKDSGAPIVLQPCVTTWSAADGRSFSMPHEQWSIVEEHGGSPKWSIKSDSSGLCLEAKPGSWGYLPPLKPGGFGLPYRGQSTLIQMPCVFGNDAQKFHQFDSNYLQRIGAVPH